MLSRGLDGLWGPNDLAAVLRHQLNAPLAFDLGALEQGAGQRVAALAQVEGPPLHTFRDLFGHPHPPVELLELTKRFAKWSARRPEAPLPKEIASVLGTLSIVVALTRCASRITELDDRELRGRVEWALAQAWLDEPTRDLLREGLPSLAAPSGAATADGARDTNPAAPAPPPPSMSAAAAPLGQLGEYVLIAKLGEGGMGAVYKARHTELDRLAAIKVLRKSLVESDWAESRFRREIKAVGALDHPNIVRAHDARRIADTHFLVMEYVDGLDLHELSNRCGPLPVADACEAARQAALGLQCAHEHGLVHRDIKPSNLMLNRRGVVKILDLGLARIHAGVNLIGETTAVGQMMGTPDYMAPEQFDDSHTVDIRADIYSLGCTLYKLLTGAAPFTGPQYKSVLAKLSGHQEQAPPPVRQSRADVDAELAAVLERMMAKTPEQRFATPAEVAEALETHSRSAHLRALLAQAEGRPIGPGPSSQTTRPQRGVGRRTRRRAFWAAAGLTLLAAAAAAWMFVGRFGTEGDGPARQDDAPAQVASAGVAASDALPGWIVLSWTRPRQGKPNLWLFRPDGKRRINVTNNPRYFDIHPKFSPDGRQIAFVRAESLMESNSVYVCNADGSQLRSIVAPSGKSERFAAPVWASNARLVYARDPKPDRQPDMEIWEVDLDGTAPRMLFRLQDAVGKGDGLVTDTSPDRRRLAIIAQQGGLPSTGDVYVTDLAGKNRQEVWADRPDDWKDSCPLWSPDGAMIAWRHNFTRGLLGKSLYYGVGLARLGADGKWSMRLQPESEDYVTPLAWAPQGGRLLCARLRDTGQKLPPATLYLMDEQFRSVRTLFDLDACPWQPAQREMGRIADWAIVPADIRLNAEAEPTRDAR